VRRSVPILAVAAILVVVLALPFALAPRVDRAGFARKIVALSPHWEGERDEFTRGFERWSARTLGEPATVEWLSIGGTSDIMRYIRSEFSRTPDGIGVDIMFGGGTSPFMELAGKGWLGPYRLPDEHLARIPTRFAGTPMYAKDFSWYGAALSGFGIVYSKPLCRHLDVGAIRTWADLGRRELFGWVALADPGKSGSAHMMYEIILQAYRWDEGFRVLSRMAANARYFTESASDIPRDVALGEVACGLAIDFYAAVQIEAAGDDVLGYVLPKGLTVMNPDAIGILKGAPNRGLAEAFVRFVLSPEGQRLWMFKAGAPGGPTDFTPRRLSILPELYAEEEYLSVKLRPFDWREPYKHDFDKASARWQVVSDLFRAAFIDTHSQAAAAWEAVGRAGRGRDLLERTFTTPLVSEDEVTRLQAKWKDPVERERTRMAWIHLFRNHYADVRSRARKASAGGVR